MSNEQGHDRELVLSLILPARQSRYLELLLNPKRRMGITRTLCHFNHVDMRYAIEIPSRHRLAPGVLQLLKSNGAPDLCYALSEDAELEGKETSPADALEFFVGRGIGTFLSRIPGKLVYFEDEDNRWLLEPHR